MYPGTLNGIRIGDSLGFSKGRSSKFRKGCRVRKTPEESRRTYRPKRFGNNNNDEDNSPKTLNYKNHKASSQKLRQLRTYLNNYLLPQYTVYIYIYIYIYICERQKDHLENIFKNLTLLMPSTDWNKLVKSIANLIKSYPNITPRTM